MAANTPLSPRQAEILRLISRGKTDKEIAAELQLSIATVKTHLRAAFARLRVRSRAQAVFRFSDR
jgi:DNA-binding CsgD family transcriptional regulator